MNEVNRYPTLSQNGLGSTLGRRSHGKITAQMHAIGLFGPYLIWG